MGASRILAPLAALALAAAPAASASAAAAPLAWQAATVSAPAGSYGASINGLDCGSAGCVAVGSAATPQSFFGPFGAVSANGGQSYSASTLPGPAPYAAVSCAGTVCVAVGGESSNRIATSTDGGPWTAATVPQPSSAQNTLSGVSCTLTYCIAVGSDLGESGAVGLFEVLRSTGGAWSVVAGLPAPAADNLLKAVSCSGSECVAVGYAQQPDGASRNVVLVSDNSGETWAQEATPQPSAQNDWLAGVSCGSPTACVAVGYETDAQGFNLNEAMFTTDGGQNWTLAATPNPGAATNGDTLQAVSCVGPQCVAVGQYASAYWVEQNEVLTSNNGGQSWTQSAAPDPAGPWADQMLNAVACGAAGCAAGGQIAGGGGQEPEALYGPA